MERTVKTNSRSRSVAFCGLSIALMAVSAWITIPFGPVPFTLQTFVMVFVLLALQPKEALASIGIYIVMGALGLPVFSSMRGGIGVIAGPTGGFIWGFLIGALLALGLLQLVGQGVRGGAQAGAVELLGNAAGASRPLVWDACAAVVFLAACYVCGWLQLAAVAGMGLEAAFLAGVAPFVLIDTAKLAFAVVVARAVRSAVK